MIRTLIVDDEPLARRHVRDLLAGHGDFELVGEAGHGGEAIARIEELRPDLVFLDIQMPETGGFDVIDAIGVEKMPLTVFVTDRLAEIRSGSHGDGVVRLRCGSELRFSRRYRKAIDLFLQT